MKQILLATRYNYPIKSEVLSPRLWTIIKNLTVILFVGLSICSKAQNPNCDAIVPYFYVDLSGSSAGTWSSPNIQRDGHCCGATGSEDCISFDVILNPGTAGIQMDLTGAVPSGSLYYSVNCAGQYPVGHINCISGIGPHHLTFCKPGSNINIYTITAISRPIFPADDSVRIGCHKQLISLGVVSNITNWTSIYPGAEGAYNSYLSCTNCASPEYTPSGSAPAYVDYRVCGAPQASNCGFAATVCDTVRIYNILALSGSINPNPAVFCNVGAGSGVTLTGNGIGGMPPYTYIWHNSSNAVVGTGSTYFATQTGNITLEVHDAFYNSATCPAFFTTTSVIQNSLPTVSAGADQTVCAASPTVSLSGAVSNSSGSSWSGGAGTFNPGNSFLNVNYTPTASEISNGSVTLTLSSAPSGGCPNVNDQVTIFFSSTILVNIAATPINCNGGTSTVSAGISGGIAPFTYLWNNSSTLSSINVGTGTYQVTVNDAIGCSGQQTYTVVSPSQLTINLSATNVTTNGGNDGTASVTVAGGTAPYSYNWTPGNPTGDGTSTISNLSFGVYSVAVTDANGCSISGSVVVNEPSCSGFSVSSTSSNVSCNGANNGTGTGFVTGGSAPFSYSWNDPFSQTNSTASNLAPGAYSLTVIDNVNCVSTTNILITQPLVLINSINPTDVSTVGGSNGSATANTSGGTAPYSYNWTPGNPTGDGTSTISGLSAGAYYLTITDAHGCSISDSVIISDPPCDALSINILTTNVSCFGGNTGSATANVAGATPPYSVVWSDGQTGNVANGFIANNYSVTITDAVNCSQTLSFTISQPTLLTVSSSHINATCFGSDNGTINLVVGGGTYPYSYSWSNGATNEDLINLAPGNYSVTVSDGKGCAVIVNETIIEPQVVSAALAITNVTCMAGSNGSIDLTVTGGTSPYSYNWSTGATTEDVSGVTAGGYSVMISDANGCLTQPSPVYFYVVQPDSLGLNSSVVDCPLPGSSTSLVTVVPSGGDGGPYQVSFDNGATFQSAGDYDADLANGSTYSVIVKDNNNCTSLISDLVPVLPDVSVSDISFNKCFPAGTVTTSVTITANGGDGGPYSVSYDNGSTFQTAGTMSFDLPVGNSYSIIVKDSKGCQTVATNIIIPGVLAADAITTSDYAGMNISCNGATDGSAAVTVAGGTLPYSYSWNSSPVQTSQSANNLGAGELIVTAQDANGCITMDTLNLTQPAVLTTNVSAVSNYNGFGVSCNGSANGLVDISVAGGTVPYTYAWNSSAATEDVTGLLAGSYSVTVTDVNGCATQTNAVITEPAAITNSIISTNPVCNGIGTGTIDLIVNGGAGTYSYNWNTGASTQDLINIGPGNYSVLIADQNGCTSTSAVSLVEPTPLTVIASITNISCAGGTTGAIDLTVNGGTSPYSYNWSTGVATEDISGISADDYNVLVADANGCTMVVSTLYFTLTEPMPLTASVVVTSDYNGRDISCFGANDGSAIVLVNGGTLPYSYTWSGSETTQSVSGLDALSYSVAVTDGNGCSVNSSATLSQPAQFVGNISSISNYNGFGVSCFNSTDGNIDLTVSGGVLPYSYGWSNGTSSEDLSGIGAGSYSVTVTDINGCIIKNDAVITEPSQMSHVVSATNAGCKGASTGSADLTVSGGVNPYTFHWSNGATTEDINGLAINSYSVLVSDMNGCIDSATTNVNEPAALVNEISKQDVLCFGQSNGAIKVNISGGTNPYTYNWSNGSSDAGVSGLPSGMYTVTIIDAMGCERTDNVEVDQPDSLHISLASPELVVGYNISSYQGTDGLINLTVNGGTSEFNYLWSNNSTTQNIQNLSAGAYSVVCTDANGCKTSASINLNHPMVLEMPTGYTPNGDGSNDNFIVHGIETYPVNLFTVFNRWGNIVYQKENYFNEWNGMNNKGEELPDGTYFVVLEINNGGLVLKGYVEMKRY